MSDVILQRILAALERIEAELKRRPSMVYGPVSPPVPAPAPTPTPQAPYYAPRWLDGQPQTSSTGRPFDPFIVC